MRVAGSARVISRSNISFTVIPVPSASTEATPKTIRRARKRETSFLDISCPSSKNDQMNQREGVFTKEKRPSPRHANKTRMFLPCRFPSISHPQGNDQFTV